MKKRYSLFLISVLLLFTAACGRDEPTPTVDDAAGDVTTPAAGEATAAAERVVPIALIDTELLTSNGTERACDSAEGVDFSCSDVAGQPQLAVNLDGTGYARWLLRLPAVTMALTGDETLLLHLRRTGSVTPNLYLVEANGRRTWVSLARYGLSEGEHQLAIPLREIRDEADQWPDFAAVNEVQIVFEWAEMAGTLDLLRLEFASIWQEQVDIHAESERLATALTVPAGFQVMAIADDLRAMTQLAFTDEHTLWVTTQNGRIWRYSDSDGDGRYNERLLYATGFEELVGLLPDPVDGAVWVGGRGRLYRTMDSDGNGVADRRELRLDGLPWGRHQNNGMIWNPDPDPFTGEAGHQWIYFGLGSTDDLDVGGEWNAQVLRFPRSGQGQANLETVSRGNRNPYMLIWSDVPIDLSAPDGATAWQLFASENGPDFNDAPDEVNHIRWQHDYGFPEQFGPVDTDSGAVDGEPYSGPLYPVTAHASASGLAYVTNPTWPAAYRTLYVSLFGQVFSEAVVGHTVERVTLTVEETATGNTYRGEPSTFVSGLDRPLPMTTAPNGDLVIGDYATGVVYQVRYRGSE